MLNFIILLFKNMENNKVFYEILKIKLIMILNGIYKKILLSLVRFDFGFGVGFFWGLGRDVVGIEVLR